MKKYPSLSMPYVESAFKGGRQRPTAIIISPSFTTSVKGAAVGIAKTWNRGRTQLDPSHYVVDETTVVRCVDDKFFVASSPHDVDMGAIRIMICAHPANASFWDLARHGMVLQKTSELVAELIVKHKIKLAYMNEQTMRRWEEHPWRRRGGIFIDENAGEWPHQHFMDAVQANIDARKRGR